MFESIINTAKENKTAAAVGTAGVIGVVALAIFGYKKTTKKDPKKSLRTSVMGSLESIMTGIKSETTKAALREKFGTKFDEIFKNGVTEEAKLAWVHWSADAYAEIYTKDLD